MKTLPITPLGVLREDSDLPDELCDNLNRAIASRWYDGQSCVPFSDCYGSYRVEQWLVRLAATAEECESICIRLISELYSAAGWDVTYTAEDEFCNNGQTFTFVPKQIS